MLSLLKGKKIGSMLAESSWGIKASVKPIKIIKCAPYWNHSSVVKRLLYHTSHWLYSVNSSICRILVVPGLWVAALQQNVTCHKANVLQMIEVRSLWFNTSVTVIQSLHKSHFAIPLDRSFTGCLVDGADTTSLWAHYSVALLVEKPYKGSGGDPSNQLL